MLHQLIAVKTYLNIYTCTTDDFSVCLITALFYQAISNIVQPFVGTMLPF